MTEIETITNADSGGGAVTTQAFQLDDRQKDTVRSWVAIVGNGFDVDVDVTVQFTTSDDPDFTKFITDADLSDVTVAAGAREGFGDEQDDPYSFIRFEIAPASDPTSGDVTVTFQKRRPGGD